MKTCRTCGAEVPLETVFCGSCGNHWLSERKLPVELPVSESDQPIGRPFPPSPTIFSLNFHIMSRRRLTAWLFIVNLLTVILILGVALLILPLPVSPPHSQTIVASTIPNLQVWTYFPTTMKLDHVYTIQTALVPTTKGTFDPQITPIETSTALVTSPSTIGTPHATIQNAFGPEYDPVATATLTSINTIFQIQRADSSPLERSLRQSSIVWEWMVQPKVVGSQTLAVSVEFRWHSLTQKKDEIYTIGYTNLTVQVEKNATPSLAKVSPNLPFNNIETIVIILTIAISLFLILGIVILLRWFRRKKRSELSAHKIAPQPGEIVPLSHTLSPQRKEMVLLSPISENLIATVRQAGMIRIFYSYAHEDQEWCHELRKHLITLKRQQQIIDWYDGEIPAGTHWKDAIQAHLTTAHLIFLLLSPDSMNSKDCYRIEKYALEKQKAGQALVIPILLRPLSLEGLPLADLQVLPRDGKPISEWKRRDEAFAAIVKEIQQMLHLLQPTDAQFTAHNHSGMVWEHDKKVGW